MKGNKQKEFRDAIYAIVQHHNCCGDCSFCNYDGECERTGGTLWERATEAIMNLIKKEQEEPNTRT